MADVRVREREEDDFEALVHLDLASAEYHASLDPAFYRVPERAPIAAFLQRRLADPDRRVLVAEVDGRVVGMVDVTILPPPDAGSIVQPVPTADLGIGVIGPWRGRGIGRTLMTAAEANARDRGARRIVLDMSSANVRALRFYEGLGYVEHGKLLRRSLDEVEE
jgi:ribosomal protein S18 acetylase RimI-like enzyme